MPDPTAMGELLAQRVPAATIYAAAVGMLAWLGGLWRFSAAAAVAASVFLAFLAGAWPTALLLTLGLGLAGAVWRWRRTRSRPGVAPAAAGAGTVSALSVLAILTAGGAAVSSDRPGFWLVASMGALAAAVSSWCALVATAGFAARRYHPLRLQPCAGPPGLSGPALALAIAAAGAIGLAALNRGLLGPGQGALVVAAAVPALIASALPRTEALGTAGRAFLASLIGAAGAVALAWLIP